MKTRLKNLTSADKIGITFGLSFIAIGALMIVASRFI